MNEPLINHIDSPDYNINFLTGINWLWKSNYKQAIQFFLIAIAETDPSDDYYSIYQSYAGLLSVLMHRLGGLHHCYYSVNLSLPIKPEVQLNLACAEFVSGNRQRAIKALDNIDGSELSSSSAKEIDSCFDLVGKREKGNGRLTQRDKFLYKSMGVLFRKKEQYDAEDIEAFIINTAKTRYKAAVHNQLH